MNEQHGSLPSSKMQVEYSNACDYDKFFCQSIKTGIKYETHCLKNGVINSI